MLGEHMDLCTEHSAFINLDFSHSLLACWLLLVAEIASQPLIFFWYCKLLSQSCLVTPALALPLPLFANRHAVPAGPPFPGTRGLGIQM